MNTQQHPDCIFCEIINGDLENNQAKIDSNDVAVAIKSKFPAADIHYLVIPRKHIESIAHATREDLEIIGELNLLAAKVAEERGIKDYKLIFNAGKYASIPHLHLHLLAGNNIEEDKT